MDLLISRNETINLLSEAFRVGYQRGRESTAASPKYVSKNKAFKLFRRSRVENWINDGLISGKPNGNGKTSTICFELAKLMELDMSETIKIRKPYITN
jgi:hypothetical protein